MAKKKRRATSNGSVGGALTGLVSIVMWITAVLVSLAVGFGMTSGTLAVPYIPFAVMQVAGWIVVILTLLGVVLKIIEKAS
jgi:hypothetical protein